MSRPALRIGWFSTGRGEGSRGLLSAALGAIAAGRLNARIEFVFCNRERGQAEGTDQFIALAETGGLRTVTLSSQGFRKSHGNKPWAEVREDFDRAVADALAPFEVDVVVNAGYMLIAPLLCRRYVMLNLHPALPGGPKGTWQQVIWELIGKGARESGALVHRVTEAVDEGPALTFCQFTIRGPEFSPLWDGVAGKTVDDLMREPGESLPLFGAIRQAGLVRERPLLVETLRAVADGQIDLGHVGRFGPTDLTDLVEAAVAGGAIRRPEPRA